MVIKVVMPKLVISMSEGRITKWLKNEGDSAQKGDPLFEVEAEKVQTVAEAVDSGILHRIVAQTGDVVPVGGLVALLAFPGEEFDQSFLSQLSSPTSEMPRETSRIEKPDEVRRKLERVTPAARRLAAQYRVDVSKVKGTGPNGRIIREDILRAAQTKPSGKGTYSVVVSEEKEMSTSRKALAEKLIRSHLTAVHVTITTSVDTTRITGLKESLAADIEKKGGTRPSYTDILVKIVSSALKEYPILNSSLENDKIKVFADINIGVAVSLADSLIVPVVREADKKSLAEIASYLKEKIEKARRGELSLDEVAGATFTVSNLGMYEVEVFTPVIDPPQCALLGVGKIIPKPWVVNNEIAVRPIVTLSLSFDHRIVDGALAARFLQRLKETIEEPQSLLG